MSSNSTTTEEFFNIGISIELTTGGIVAAFVIFSLLCLYHQYKTRYSQRHIDRPRGEENPPVHSNYGSTHESPTRAAVQINIFTEQRLTAKYSPGFQKTHEDVRKLYQSPDDPEAQREFISNYPR